MGEKMGKLGGVKTITQLTKAGQDISLASPDTEPFVRAETVAKQFAVHKRTVALWAENEKIPHYRIGGAIRFKMSEVMEAAAKAGAFQ